MTADVTEALALGPVFPVVLTVQPGGRVAKRPAIRAAHAPGASCHGGCGQQGHGHHDATLDPQVIAGWQRTYPRAQWGIPTGPAGLVVIDPDTAKGPAPSRVLPDQAAGEETPPGIIDGDDVLCWAAERSGGTWPIESFTVRTASGGRHVYLRCPTGLVVTSGAGMTGGLGWLVDVRASGGWVVAPGSTCPAGSWDVEDSTPPAPLPGWLLHRLVLAGRVPSLMVRPPEGERRPVPAPVPSSGDRRPYVEAAVTRELSTVANALQGERNETLNRASFSVGQLVAAYGLDLRTTADALLAAAQAAGLGEAEAKNTIKSGLAAGRRSPRRIGGAA